MCFETALEANQERAKLKPSTLNRVFVPKASQEYPKSSTLNPVVLLDLVELFCAVARPPSNQCSLICCGPFFFPRICWHITTREYWTSVWEWVGFNRIALKHVSPETCDQELPRHQSFNTLGVVYIHYTTGFYSAVYYHNVGPDVSFPRFGKQYFRPSPTFQAHASN